jgi:hypothetical protein
MISSAPVSRDLLQTLLHFRAALCTPKNLDHRRPRAKAQARRMLSPGQMRSIRLVCTALLLAGNVAIADEPSQKNLGNGTPSIGSNDDPRANAQFEYDRLHIEFDDPSEQFFVVRVESLHPLLGIARVPLSRREFFRLVGHDEVNAELARESAAANRIGWVSAGQGAVGQSLAVLAELFTLPCVVGSRSDLCSAVFPMLETGAVLTGTAAGGALTTAAIYLRPFSAKDLRSMARDYNRRLRERLQLPVDETIPPQEPKRSWWSAAPVFSQSFAGLGFNATF